MVGVVVATAADGGNGDVINFMMLDGRYSSLEWVCSAVSVNELQRGCSFCGSG